MTFWKDRIWKRFLVSHAQVVGFDSRHRYMKEIWKQEVYADELYDFIASLKRDVTKREINKKIGLTGARLVAVLNTCTWKHPDMYECDNGDVGINENL